VTPCLIAHRGCAEQFPENTVEAMRRVASHVDAVEFDVRRCASGEVVVIHDETVDRVTDRTGRVADLTFSDLAACDVLDTGAGVPRLEDVLDAVPDAVAVNVELKQRGVAADVVDALDGRANRALVSSFLPNALAELRDVDSAVDRALLFGGGIGLRPEDGDPLDVAADLGCAAVHPSADACLDGDLVSRAHDRGFTVNAWTVRTPSVANRLVAAGVDGLVADRYDVLDR